jgi:hypothetical protein
MRNSLYQPLGQKVYIEVKRGLRVRVSRRAGGQW